MSVTSAAFFVAMALLLQRGNPRFAQLSSTMFGLFYCGYLPCFWVKLRCGLAVPALNTSKTLFYHAVIGKSYHMQNVTLFGLVMLYDLLREGLYHVQNLSKWHSSGLSVVENIF